jgi:hypothetical protein
MATLRDRKAGNRFSYDDALNPDFRDSMWADFPFEAVMHDPTLAAVYKNNFQTFDANDWTITETGAGGTVAGTTDEIGGGILITTDTADDDSEEMQLGTAGQENILLIPGRPFWMETALKLSDATNSDLLFGACITDTALIDGLTDGVYFLKSDLATAITFHSEKDSNDTTGNTGVDLVDGNWVRLGIKMPSAGTSIQYWVNGVHVQTASTLANIPENEYLRASLAVQNGNAAAMTLKFGFLWIAQYLGNLY